MTPDEARDVIFRKPGLGERGYDESAVDVLLERVEEALRGTRTISRQELSTSALPTARMGRRGYRKDDVDAFIQRVLTDTGEMRIDVGELRTPWHAPAADVAGEHHPNMRAAWAHAFLWASVWAALAGMAVDYFVVTRDPNFGTPGYITSASTRLAVTGVAVTGIGALALWTIWRVMVSLVWDKGGLAYRASAKRAAAIAWRDITAIHEKPHSSVVVVITANTPEVGPDFKLAVGCAGEKPGRRWSVWSLSQQGLIDALQAARAAAATSRFTPPQPAPPAAPRYARALVAVWLLLAVSITVVVVFAVDRGTNFTFLHGLFDHGGAWG